VILSRQFQVLPQTMPATLHCTKPLSLESTIPAYKASTLIRPSLVMSMRTRRIAIVQPQCPPALLYRNRIISQGIPQVLRCTMLQCYLSVPSHGSNTSTINSLDLFQLSSRPLTPLVDCSVQYFQSSLCHYFW
jgi:hypothetical protein